MIDKLLEYWKLVLSGIFLVIFFGLILYVDNTKASLKQEELALGDRIEELNMNLNKDHDIDEDEEIEVIERSGVYLDEFGEEMIDIQKYLSKWYRRAEFTEDEIKNPPKELTDANNALTRLTGVTQYGEPWMLNPNWSIELESVGLYSNTEKVPVVFMMYTKEDDLAGIVRGVYNIDEDLMDDIIVNYTSNGIRTEVDAGGE